METLFFHNDSLDSKPNKSKQEDAKTPIVDLTKEDENEDKRNKNEVKKSDGTEAKKPEEAEEVKKTMASKPAQSQQPQQAKSSNEENEGQQPQGDCAICDKLAKSFCSGCKHVFYCTREHQKQHWNSHKEDCKTLAKLPYRVSKNTGHLYFVLISDPF